MDLNQVMAELDELFTQERISEVPEFLMNHIAQAKKEGAQDILLTLYNECIGFYRETGQYDLAIEYCHRAIDLMDVMGLQNTIPYATTLLNAATAHRAAGLLHEALELYNKVRPIYVAQLPEDDMYFAGLYNNLGILYQEVGDFEAAKEQLSNALHIVTHKPDTQFEVAVTQTNLANTCIELGQDDEAKARAEEAIRIFEEIGVDDAHYSAALSALGSLYYMDKDYLNALNAMEKSRNCLAKYLGKDNTQYQRISANIEIIKEKMTEEAIAANVAMLRQEMEESAGEEAYGYDDIFGADAQTENGIYDAVDEADRENDAAVSHMIAEVMDEITEDAFAEPFVAEEPSAEFAALDFSASAAAKLEKGSKDSGMNTEPERDAEQMESAELEADKEQKQNAESTELETNTELEADIEQMESVALEADTESNKLETDIEQNAEPEELATDAEQKQDAESGKLEKDIRQNQNAEPEADTESKKLENNVEPEKPAIDTEQKQDAKLVSDTEQKKDAKLETETKQSAEPEKLATDTEQEPQQLVSNEPELDFTPEITGMELCRRYYEEYGKPMIAEKFPAYASRIAVGLVGKGSDCFGFDDMQSRDHDFGPRFVMWVTKEVYDQIGESLQQAYDELPQSFMGVDRLETFHGKDRAGVMVIEDFYRNTLGANLIGILLKNSQSDTDKMDKETFESIKCWLTIHEHSFAAAVNGEVFRDDEGIFTKYRNKLLEYYPKPVWYRRIAQACALFSQNGQYNLPRMRKRKQMVAAQLAKVECMKQAMKLYYLLNRKYAPHDKWLFKGMPENADMVISDMGMENESVASLVEKISLLPVDDAHAVELTTLIESLAVIFANELERQGIVGTCDLYLDYCTKELEAKSDALLTAIMADTPIITALSLSIAKAEFEAFDKVENEDGRASCQNNWPTFKVMRMSQYMTWTEDMLLQYLYEFKTNYADGRNMIEEKYARMMESTAPEKYASFADKLPVISEEKKLVIEQIVALQVKWMEEFAAEYPKLAGNARTIHTMDDMPYDTSYETYLRGELGTYSDRMLSMYGRYVVAHAKSGKNLAREIMENTIHFYGYEDFETANEKGL